MQRCIIDNTRVSHGVNNRHKIKSRVPLESQGINRAHTSTPLHTQKPPSPLQELQLTIHNHSSLNQATSTTRLFPDSSTHAHRHRHPSQKREPLRPREIHQIFQLLQRQEYKNGRWLQPRPRREPPFEHEHRALVPEGGLDHAER
jgi:hypothetical protein